MSKFTTAITAIALVATIALPAAGAQARGKGGPASSHRGCLTNNGIPLDDGQSVVVDGVTITCNDGTVCHFANNGAYCYVNVQAASMSSGNTTTAGGDNGQQTSPKHAPTRKNTAAASR
jgi:hypothetical protein